MYKPNVEYDCESSNITLEKQRNASDLEMKTEPFKGISELEINTSLAETNHRNVEIDKAGVICVFYICKLPFVKC